MDARIATARIDGLDAVTIRDRIAGGALRAVEVAEAYLTVTAQKESGIGAFAHLDFGFHPAWNSKQRPIATNSVGKQVDPSTVRM